MQSWETGEVTHITDGENTVNQVLMTDLAFKTAFFRDVKVFLLQYGMLRFRLLKTYEFMIMWPVLFKMT